MYGQNSRYKHSDVYKRDVDSAIYLDLRPRIDYLGGHDEILHRVVAGDTLQTLAMRYYTGLPYPAGLWWAIADFQPEPMNDPTVALEPGTWIVIPSPDLVQQWLLEDSDTEVFSV